MRTESLLTLAESLDLDANTDAIDGLLVTQEKTIETRGYACVCVSEHA